MLTIKNKTVNTEDGAVKHTHYDVEGLCTVRRH